MRQPLLTCCALLLMLSVVACKKETTPPVDEAPKTAPAPAAARGETAAPVAAAEPEATNGGFVQPAEEGGQWVHSVSYGVKFRAPEDWVIKLEPDGITATDEDETTTVVLVGSESAGMIQSAINDIQKKVKIKDMQLEKSGDVVLNGLPGQSVRGTAVLTKADGMDQEIQFIAYNVQVGAKGASMMIFSEAEMYEAKKEIIEGLGNTLSKR